MLHFLVLCTYYSEMESGMESDPNVVLSTEKVMLFLSLGRRKINIYNELVLLATFTVKYPCYFSLLRTKIRNSES